MAAEFHREHQRRYGYHHATREIELVTLRVRARLRTPELKFTHQIMERKTAKRVSPVERVAVVFQAKALATPVFERADLVPDQIMRGPAVITEYSATTVIPPKKKFWVDRAGNLLIKIK